MMDAYQIIKEFYLSWIAYRGLKLFVAVSAKNASIFFYFSFNWDKIAN